MLHCLLHCAFGVVLLKVSLMLACLLCCVVDSKKLSAIGFLGLCFGNLFFMCHWEQQQHGR